MFWSRLVSIANESMASTTCYEGGVEGNRW
jgi:hypothetical protein